MKIILYVRNNKDIGKLSIDTLRMIGRTEENIDLVVLDNASDDGFNEWASTQEDFTYVYIDEGYMPFGKAVNLLVNELDMDEDFLLMDSSFFAAPGSINHMATVMESGTDIALVSAMCNLATGSAKEAGGNYEACSKMYLEKENAQPYRLLAPSVAFAYINFDIYKKVRFDEDLENIVTVIDDFSLKAVKAGYKVLLDRNAFAWKQAGLSEDADLDERGILEKKWGTHYFNVLGNSNIVNLVADCKNKEMTILEVGCDMGATLLEIKNRCPASKLYGLDINDTSVGIASSFAEAATANVDEEEIPFDVQFDYIIFGDVLEHLRNPLGALIKAKNKLNPLGKIIISVPNLMHVSVMKELLNGNFTYTEVGLLDKTHIHLFTYNELVKMISEADLEKITVGGVSMPISEEEEKLISSLVLLGNGTEPYMYKTYQYIAVAGKKKTD